MDLNKLLEGLEKRYGNTSATITVRMKPTLLSELDALCDTANTTRSKVIKTALEHYLSATKPTTDTDDI
ncbi:ribbon-helix-helix protein, CopG family [Hymenobacter sp. BT188]|uniref:ribbon-helix-helix domain-containing protein n=1 Tax=Hymenobacter sp. BT188 TaxID=2763504 RepID=UPI001650DE28|nr:ribbon-helix-helix domain-containing protein [Hymenobacter sp. BT188]MBC6605621.1 ribbon-helix-helix protein, CopG family [Hymenobacter sp. BT188]